MNPRKLVAGLVGAAAITTMAISAPTASAAAPGQAIVDTVVNDSRFDVLQQLVTDPSINLAGAVAGLSGATVFAPADQSFRGLVVDVTNNFGAFFWTDKQIADTLLAAVPADVLKTVILYHVGFGTPGGVYDTAAGESLDIQSKRTWFGSLSLRDGDPTDINPFTVGSPINAGNGNTVYVIAGVLRPIELDTLLPGDD
jgi:serralysin